ncbi:hypothetical protein DFJ73DRAFT_665918 [Zopfochytrium polystomum]|nr:hypothetical protein DFJ73DRAFT_665918 [Zopfochytrium polystomum]
MTSLESVKDRFRGVVVVPGDDLYNALVYRFSPNEEARPQVIFQPCTEADVAVAINYATSNNLELAVCSGGHSFLGASSSDGVIIDLKRMRTAWVENAAYGAAGHVVMEGGATVADVALACERRGVFVPVPSHKEIGYAGFALGGGFGWGMGVYGMAADGLVDARVVLASGECVTESATENAELYFALRGAAYNFGVVTKMRFRAVPLVSKVWFGAVLYPPPAYAAVIEALGGYAKSQKKEDMAALTMAGLIPGQEDMFVLMLYYHGDSEEEYQRRFRVFFELPFVKDTSRECWFHESADFFPESIWPPTNRLSDGTLITDLSPEVLMPLVDETRAWMRGGKGRGAGTQFYIGLYDWTKPLTEFAHLESAWPPHRRKPADPNGNIWRDVAIYVGHAKKVGGDIIKGTGYPNAAVLKEHKGDYIYGENYSRLQLLKKKYDPANVFHKKHPIVPAE